MTKLFNSILFSFLVAVLILLSACRDVPNADVPPAWDYPEHKASSQARQLLGQAQDAEGKGWTNWNNALPLYWQYLHLCPWDIKVRQTVADGESEAHHYQLALNEYIALLKYVRTHDTPQWDFNIENQSRVWLTMGDCYEELNQPKPALEYYRKALELDTPELTVAGFYTHYRFAKAYVKLKDYCDAYYHFQLMNTNDLVHPEDGMSFYNEIKSQIPEDPCRHRPGAN